MAEFPSAIKNLLAAFERLPGIGPKSATRLVFYLLNTPQAYVESLTDSLLNLKKEIKNCQECFGVSERDICNICDDKSRDKKIICVVERAIDMMAIENIGGYKGVYHVLGGVINPLDHVGPDDIRIKELIERIEEIGGGGEKMEIILATNPTMEGEATALYIKKQIDNRSFEDVTITRIGSGLPIGADLEYADQATLSRAMDGRRNL